MKKESGPFLAGLTKKERALVRSHLKHRLFSKGEQIFTRGEAGDELMFVISGRVKISTMSDEGRELSYTQLQAGEFFGELALLASTQRSADAVAVEQTEVYVMSRESFDACLEFPAFSRFVIRQLALRLLDSSNRFSELILYDLYHNVAQLLKSIATPAEVNGEQCLVIDERPTHQELAAMVGSSREVITRVLKNLQIDRCITVEGRRVIIHESP